MSFVEALLPSDLRRCARRLSTFALVLAAFAWALFPSVTGAGTETESDRMLTTLALVAIGIALRVLGPNAIAYLASLVVLAGVGIAAHAAWVAVFAGGGVLYMGVTVLRAGGRKPGEDGTAPEPPQLSGVDMVRENVEAIATALVLALLVREFAFEAFKIPTASMEPTIYGNSGKRQGDRLLANKWWYRLSRPERWSIMVFKFPLYRPINYIKRLVGLPGETLEIVDGDIYVNGVVTPKPDEVQSQLWLPLHPPRHGEAPPVSRAFRASPQTQWKFGERDATVDAPPGDVAWLSYDGGGDIPDLRIGADANVRRAGDTFAVFARVDGRGRSVEVEFGRDGCFLTAPGFEREKIELAGFDAVPTDRIRFGLGIADRVARVYVNGRQVARVPYRDDEGDRREEPLVSLGVRDGAVALKGLTVAHDLHYRPSPGGGAARWEIPEDSFLMLGDNTRSSRDSRAWTACVIHTQDGREFVADDRIKLEDGTSVRNVRVDTETGFIRFQDSYGIAREFRLEEAEYERDVRRPFVHRDDLLGRAFFTFFPFPPFGEFRPRFLP